MSISDMLEYLSDHCNEVGIGYNDSGCFWTVCVGGRGAGSFIQGVGKTFTDNELEDDDNGEKGLCYALWSAVKEKAIALHKQKE